MRLRASISLAIVISGQRSNNAYDCWAGENMGIGTISQPSLALAMAEK